jgi:hypothetical protein
MKDIEPGTTVLLLGSGFSLGSTNLKNASPPNGSGLRRHFIDLLNLPADTSYDLQILTDEFAENDSDLLYSELYDTFRIARLNSDQKAVLSEKWLRIYSTNYDDAVEFYQTSQGEPIVSFDVAQSLPNRIPKNSVVHLHGSIRAMTRDNIQENLVLGEASYVRQYLERSPWYGQFQADIRFASKLIIVGYSISDYHISALLLENPDIAKKTFFIQGPTPDEVFIRRTSGYGKALFIGVSGLAEGLQKLPRPDQPTDITRLKSFRFLDPLRDKKSLRPPTANEVLELLVFGSFNYSRCVSTLPDQTYVISRHAEVAKVTSALADNRSVIIDSRLGNGKTVFLHLCFIELAAKGFACFQYKIYSPSIEAEISLLKSVKNLVILFDQYTLAQDIIQKLASELPNAKFIVEIRTSIMEVRYHDLIDHMPKPFGRVGINKMSATDLAAFRALCSNSGLAAGNSIGKSTTEMRDVLLELFESEQIKDRIKKSLTDLFSTASRRKVLLLAMLLSTYQISVEPTFIKSVTGVDPYHEFKPVQEIADEVFEIGVDEFRMRSSLFSEYAVRHFMDSVEISDCVVQTSLAAAERKSTRQFRVLMSNLLQYSSLHSVLRSQQNASQLIIDIYERLRYDQRINDEPLFWLQYAIAMAEVGKLLPAREFIGTAYKEAAARPGFETYQIDTQAFRILLLIETEAGAGIPVFHFDEIIKMLGRFDTMLSEESHRAFAIKVIEGVSPFVSLRINDLSSGEKTSLKFWLEKLSKTLERFTAEYKARTGSEFARKAINQAVLLLK